MIIPTLYQVKKIGYGQLSMMAKPREEWLIDEIKALGKMGVEVIISLLTKEEEKEVKLQTEKAACIDNNIEFISYPIIDRSVPSDMNDLSNFVGDIYNLISSGRNTVIHCRAGIGRSGLLSALVLLHDGLATKEAFEILSQSRGVEVPDTEEQYEFVANYEQLSLKR